MSDYKSKTPTTIKIVSRMDNSWIVKFTLDVRELLDTPSLVEHLHLVKRVISDEETVPVDKLAFDEIIEKVQYGNYVDVTVRINELLTESGQPEIRFCDDRDGDGTAYPDMQALLRFYYLDEEKSIIKRERIDQAIMLADIRAEYLDEEIISAELQRVLQSQAPGKEILIAAGRLPEHGSDAEVELFFESAMNESSVDRYYSTRHAKSGDLLCRKKPAGPGKQDGYNVHGVALPARSGLDIELIPDQNTTLGNGGLEIVSNKDGLVVVEKAKRHVEVQGKVREFTKHVKVKVNEISRINGKDLTSISANTALEIDGSIGEGCQILSDSQVFVSDSIESNTSVDAGDDIIVKGGISGASISSNSNVIASGSVSGSRISARGKVIMTGEANNCAIAGDSVSIGSILDCEITSRHDVVLQRVEKDEEQTVSSIYVGVYEFFMKRLKENQDFLEGAKASLEKIGKILGPEIMEQVTPANTRIMLMKFLARTKEIPRKNSQAQFEAYRDIIDAICPTKYMIEDKERECQEIAEMLALNENLDECSVFVKNQITRHTQIKINGNLTELPVGQGEIEIKVRKGEIYLETESSKALITH